MENNKTVVFKIDDAMDNNESIPSRAFTVGFLSEKNPGLKELKDMTRYGFLVSVPDDKTGKRHISGYLFFEEEMTAAELTVMGYAGLWNSRAEGTAVAEMIAYADTHPAEVEVWGQTPLNDHSLAAFLAVESLHSELFDAEATIELLQDCLKTSVESLIRLRNRLTSNEKKRGPKLTDVEYGLLEEKGMFPSR